MRIELPQLLPRMIKFLALLLIAPVLYATEYINVNIGVIGLNDKEHSTRTGIEYRGKALTSLKLIPSMGAMWTDNGARYMYIEARRDFYFTPAWAITPSFGLGAFRDSNDNVLQLGHTLEFRSGIEASYKFVNEIRAGAAVYHLSNCGISSTNPGTESIVFSVHFPIDLSE